MTSIRHTPQKPRLGSILWAMAAFPFAPRRMALQVAGVSLRTAYVWHLLALLNWPVMTIVLVAYSETYNFPQAGATRYRPFAEGLAQTLKELLDAASDPEFWLVFLIVFAILEVGFLLAATLLLLWGTQTEALKETFARTLRTVWLNTFHGVWWILIFGAVTTWTGFQRYDLYWSNFDVDKGQIDWGAIGDVSWVYRNQEFLMGWAAVIASAWVLWAWFRAAATPTARSCPLLPPCCEHCGYNLFHVPANRRCPECGAGVDDSLGPDARRPIKWEPSGGRRFFRTLLTVTAAVITNPRKFFFTLPARSGQRPARKFFLLCMLLAAGLTYPLINIVYFTDLGRWPRGNMAYYMPFFCVAGFAVPLILIGFVGTTTGLERTYIDKRNRMPAAAKVVFYSSGIVLIWGMAALLLLAGTLLCEQPLRVLSWSLFREREALFILINAAFNGLCLVYYLSIVRRGMLAMRFANR